MVRRINLYNVYITLIDEMICFLQYTKSVQFEEKPSYQYLKSLLLNLFEKNKLEYDFVYDWYYINDKESKDTNDRSEN